MQNLNETFIEIGRLTSLKSEVGTGLVELVDGFMDQGIIYGIETAIIWRQRRW